MLVDISESAEEKGKRAVPKPVKFVQRYIVYFIDIF